LLTSLELNSNHLFSSLPSSFSHLENLVYLSVSDNLLSKSIPSSWINCFPFLYELYLDVNMFTGPTHPLETLPNITYFYVNNNFFTKSFLWPVSNDITYFQLQFNQLTGALPFKNQSKIIMQYAVSYNYFSGPLPSFLSPNSNYLTEITSFYVSNNYLTGTLSDMKGMVIVFNASTNLLTGTLPSEMVSTGLEELFVDSNFLVGSILPSIGNLSHLVTLHG
jgi:LRR receptor-like serine/threonine-protein kinase FLS2